MAINATCGGKVSPFDFGDVIRVRYKTAGRKIEGDFKAYKKTDTEWEFAWTEKDFNYEWYCWVETTYGRGEWKVEFIDRIAGVIEAVTFTVGNIIECYRGVNIYEDVTESLPFSIQLGLAGISFRLLEQCKYHIDDTISKGGIFNQCVPPPCTAGEIRNVVWCPDYETKKSHEICIDGKWESRQISSCLKSSTKTEFIALIQEKGGRIEYEKISTNVYLRNAWYYHESKRFLWIPPIGSITYREDVAGKIRRVLEIKNIKTRNPPNNVADILFTIHVDYDPDGKTELVDYQWAVSCINKLPFEEEGTVCTEGQKRNETYCPDGTMLKTWEECIDIKWEAKTQTCPVTCTEGQKRNIFMCPDGEYMRSWEECVSGEWVSKTGVCGCADGTTSCQRYDLYTCIGGEWVLKEKNSIECGYTENGKISILDPIISWIETSFDVDRKTAEMYAYLGIAGIGAVFILGVMSK